MRSPDLAQPLVSTRTAAWRTLAISSLATLATFLDTTILFVAFSDITRSFSSASPASLSWVLNAYTIAFAALLVPAGKTADRIGHKLTFIAGSALFTVASVLCAVAPSVETLIVFRIVQAAGAAALLPSSLALVLRAFPRERIPVAVSVWGATGAVAGAIGPTLGSALVEAADWRWVFLINLPVGIATMVTGWSWLTESKDETTRIPSPAGVVLIASAASLIALGVVQTDTWGWIDWRSIGAVAAGAALLGVFVCNQARSETPVIDLDLFRSANFRWANLAMIAFSVVFSAMLFGSILYLINVWRWSVLEAGLGISPGPLLVAVLAPTFGRVATRTGQRPLIVAGGLLFALGAVWRLAFLGTDPDYVTTYLPSMLFTGTGVALCLPQLAGVVAQSLPANRFGVGGAVSQATRQFGGTLGVALAIAFMGQPASIAEAVTSFERIWWLMLAGGVLTAVLALRLQKGTAAIE
jgi:EmrB/QacA subfamily drug resistance transporter